MSANSQVARNQSRQTFDSVYESTNQLTTVAGERMVEWFTGNSLNTDRWNTSFSGSGGAVAMSNTVDGGLELKSSTSGRTIIDFAPADPPTARTFNADGFVQITVMKLTDVNYSLLDTGMRTNYYSEAGANISSQVQADLVAYGGEKFRLVSGGFTNVDTDQTGLYDWHTHKLESTDTTSSLTIDGILKATAVGNASGTGYGDVLMPFVECHNTEVTAPTNPYGYVHYMECYNT